jgi:hypothetical protein
MDLEGPLTVSRKVSSQGTQAIQCLRRAEIPDQMPF